MTPEEWQRAKPILDSALQLDSAHRAAFLKEACAEPSLRREIESLIAAHEQAGTDALNSATLSRSTLSRGTKLGDFQILSLLGAGGMGEVYRARDLRLDRDVAIKVLPRFVSLDPERLRRFEQEAKAAAALNHPNILAVFHMGTYEDAPYLVSELLEGETLREQVKRGPIPQKKAVDYGVQIAHGLAAAHEKGIVHRDLKPENLFVTRDGRIKILDFGLAKLLHPESETQLTKQTLDTQPGAVMGTVGYMAPEQVRGLAADHRADIFAFGAILYEMLTGRRAFHKSTFADTMSAILNEDPPSVSQTIPNLPPALDRALQRCLEKSPEQRFQSASDLAFALELSSDSAVSTRAIPSGKPRLVWRLVAAVGIVLALVSGALVWRSKASARLTDKDTVVLSDFANTTGDPIFSETLKDALGVSLRQSPFLDIASDEKVISTLRLMTKPPDTALTPQVTREVCQRMLGKAYIGGSIASLGSQYVVGLKAVNCGNGDVLAQEQVTAAGKEKVLEALGNAASKLRGKLGESLTSVQKSDLPLEQLTTSSLEALEAFNLGAKAQLEGKGESVALSYFLRAIELDPKFAHAHSSAGVMYRALGDYRRSNEYLTKAFALRDRASLYENLLMQADYHYLVFGDVDKSLPLYQQMAESYPRQVIPWSYLSHIYSDLGQLEKASEADVLLVRLEPDTAFFYPQLIRGEVNLGRLQDAHKAYDSAVSRGFDDSDLRRERYLLAFVEGDAKATAEQIAWFEKRPLDSLMLLFEAQTEAYYGHVRGAREATRRALATAMQAGNRGHAAFFCLYASWREAALGNEQDANRQARAALDIAPENEDVEARAAEVLARTGDTGRAEKLSQDLAKRFPQNTLIQRYWLPRIHARLSLAAKKPAEAVEQLRVAGPMEARSCNYSYDRGEAYLAAGQGAAAAAAFQQVLDRPGLVTNCLPGAL
ncbi:MAG TPA: protein kinase, partial [Candidatus Acidoferrum sp.]|nr:protein kinase [Candidatus Acidoferrum sp.]